TDNGVIAGWSDGTFRPNNICNRASVVTFLWRMAGCPEPGTMASFDDMPEDTEANSDFRNAISWAVEEGITTGWADNTFRPWNTCNRAAIVTFLWRFAGKPKAGTLAEFSDMTDNPDFNQAISWASEQGITTGWADNTFRPWNNCLRLAVASFLYRYDQLP
ncbi:MAG: S-layer homology domain-containing protein, partial [Lachnospiraceae bacterium]|nr:S-layer homology domain-containing protein [Lachnospiraceae bacterium]